MPLKSYKPTSPGVRQKTTADFSGLTKKKAEKKLLQKRKKTAGRNSYGRITVRRRGGGAKQKVRIIDWRRDKHDIPAKVQAIEYDPIRSARLLLLAYADGAKTYIIAPEGVKVGDVLVSGEEVDPVVGNCMPLKSIPVGTIVHNVELRTGRGGQLVRSAGNGAQLMAKEGKYAQLRMPSGEYRLVRLECKATVGYVGNAEHENISIGKAGRNRHMGKRPSVRGKVMNPCDHPHGGGEGRTSIGLPGPVTPWGVPTLGKKTRNKKKYSNKFIVRRAKNRRKG